MAIVCDSHKKIIIKDSTLREGLDTPSVEFTMKQRLRIARLLDSAELSEMEIAAPGSFIHDLEFAAILARERLQIRSSGLVYAHSSGCREEIQKGSDLLNRFDILMSVSPERKPHDKEAKTSILLDALEYSLSRHTEVGVGFPNSTQADPDFLIEIGLKAVNNGAGRITIYDTNGSSDPFETHGLIRQLKGELHVPIFFHGHNDLGMAAANSVSAVLAGAEGLDVTVNGLGDRAGNASLEQVAMALYLKGFETGISLKKLMPLSKAVEEESRVPLSKLSPVVGEFAFSHKSPAHMEHPGLFEAFDPGLVGEERRLNRPELK